MKKLFPLLLVAAAAYWFIGKKRTYRVSEVDGPVTYIILKEGDRYWQFDIPSANVGLAVTRPPNAQESSAYDYARLTGTEYPS